jgi:hypothetical protein
MKCWIIIQAFLINFAFPMLGCNLKQTRITVLKSINVFEKAKDTLFIKDKIRILPFGLTGESVVKDYDRVMYSDSLYYVSFNNKSNIKAFEPNGNGGGFLEKELPDLGNGSGGIFKFINYCIFQGRIYVLLSSGAINVYDVKSYNLLQKIGKPSYNGSASDIFVDSGYLYIV